MNSTVSQLLQQAYTVLKHAGIPSFALDAQLLLAHCMGKDRLFVLTHPHHPVENPACFWELVQRREANEPVAYLLGRCEFMSLDWEVNRHTLIPRPDTECLVERVASWVLDKPMRLLDIGTGSGCIAISLLHQCPNATALAVDVCPKALEVAQRNAKRHGVLPRIALVQMDMLRHFPDGAFDVIVSNPPYIPPHDIQNLMPDVRDYEPYKALDGGPDGLDFYRVITAKAKTHLLPNGRIAFEVGHNQSTQVLKLLQQNGFQTTGVADDLSGIHRVVWGQL